MQLQFTNAQIFFSVSQCFPDLHHRFKTHLADLVLENDDPNYLQSVNITPEQLAHVYRSVSTIAEGEARKINGEMKAALLPQLMVLAGQENEEALAALGMLQQIDQMNDLTRDAKITAGKEAILA